MFVNLSQEMEGAEPVVKFTLDEEYEPWRTEEVFVITVFNILCKIFIFYAKFLYLVFL